MKLTAA